MTSNSRLLKGLAIAGLVLLGLGLATIITGAIVPAVVQRKLKAGVSAILLGATTSTPATW
jgi:hypothetical protein